MTGAAPLPGPAEEPRRVARTQRWLLLAIAAGVFIAADDQTTIVTVLPAILHDIHLPVSDFYRASWIVNSYLLGYLVALPLLGRVADVYGHARVFAVAVGLFLIGSAAVAVAPSFEAIVIARGVQAIGGGGVVPVAMAIVVGELPPRQRALGLGAIAAAAEAGALIGPLWGGAITELAGWRWVFWINLPMLAPVLVGVWRLGGRGGRRGPVDWPGAALLGAALALLTFALVDDPNAPRPLGVTAAMIAGAAAIGGVFAWHELRTRMPMVRLSMFRPRAVAAANLANVFVGGGLITALIGVPLFVNLVLVEPALQGGLTLMRLTVGVPLGALAGGLLAGRLPLRVPAAAGMLLAALGFAGLQAWNEPLAQWLRTLPQVVGGFGFGLVIAPLATAVLQRVSEHERATASSWLVLCRIAGMLVGASLLTSTGLGRFYARVGTVPFDSPDFRRLVEEAQVSTFHDVFVVAALVMVLAAAIAWFVGRGDPESNVEPWWTVA